MKIYVDLKQDFENAVDRCAKYDIPMGIVKVAHDIEIRDNEKQYRYMHIIFRVELEAGENTTHNKNFFKKLKFEFDRTSPYSRRPAGWCLCGTTAEKSSKIVEAIKDKFPEIKWVGDYFAPDAAEEYRLRDECIALEGGLALKAAEVLLIAWVRDEVELSLHELKDIQDLVEHGKKFKHKAFYGNAEQTLAYIFPQLKGAGT